MVYTTWHGQSIKQEISTQRNAVYNTPTCQMWIHTSIPVYSHDALDILSCTIRSTSDLSACESHALNSIVSSIVSSRVFVYVSRSNGFSLSLRKTPTFDFAFKRNIKPYQFPQPEVQTVYIDLLRCCCFLFVCLFVLSGFLLLLLSFVFHSLLLLLMQADFLSLI